MVIAVVGGEYSQTEKVVEEIVSHGDGTFSEVAAKNVFIARHGVVNIGSELDFIHCLEDSAIPFAVVFVDCEKFMVRWRAKKAEDDVRAVMARHKQYSKALRKLRDSGNYSLYLDNTSMDADIRDTSAFIFMNYVTQWLRNRDKDDMHLPYVSEQFEDWQERERRCGFCVIERVM